MCREAYTWDTLTGLATYTRTVISRGWLLAPRVPQGGARTERTASASSATPASAARRNGSSTLLAPIKCQAVVCARCPMRSTRALACDSSSTEESTSTKTTCCAQVSVRPAAAGPASSTMAEHDGSVWKTSTARPADSLSRHSLGHHLPPPPSLRETVPTPRCRSSAPISGAASANRVKTTAFSPAATTCSLSSFARASSLLLPPSTSQPRRSPPLTQAFALASASALMRA
mmetsp:Transcript_6910/g.22113  ORF Transcript_6910/g.22113 Transcript_6910/m.22113 type:complete len:231 (+) Transcript_6910:82-774(+)